MRALSDRAARWRLAAFFFLAGSALAGGQDFYEMQLQAGEAALAAGRAGEAAEDLRIAAFGLLERPALLCKALANLSLAQQAVGGAARADEALERYMEVERRFASCGEAGLDARRRAEFEALVRQRLPASVAEEVLATRRPAAVTAVPASPVPTATPAPAARESASAATLTRDAPRPTPVPLTAAPAATSTPSLIPAATATPSAARVPSDDLDRQPQLKTTTRPAYPESLQRAKIGGVVLLSVRVSVAGEPVEIELSRGVHPELDQAAIEAVRQWRFDPGRKGGVPVAAWMTVAVPFDVSPR
jgi:protein TonB